MGIKVKSALEFQLERCPFTFVQSLGRPIVWSISHSFWLTGKNFTVSETRQKFWLVSDFFVHPLIERLAEKNSETGQEKIE